MSKNWQHVGRWSSAGLPSGSAACQRRMAARWTLSLAAIATLTLPSSCRLYVGTAAIDGKRGCRWGCKHLPTGPELSIQTVGELVWNDMHPVNMSRVKGGALRSPCWTTADGTNKCLPALFVVGLPKCGTTDFAAKIGYHPLLQMSKHKEPHYWTRCSRGKHTSHTCPLPDNPSTAALTTSFNEYLNLWKANKIIKSGSLAYEASASTFWELRPFQDHGVNLTTPELLHKTYGQFADRIRIIVLFRDPLARSWSDYTYMAAGQRYKQHMLMEEHNKLGKKVLPPRPNKNSFHDNVKSAIALYQDCFTKRSIHDCATDHEFSKGEVALQNGRLGIGLYEPMLKEWAKTFGPNQLLAIRAEDLWNNASKVFDEVFDFLEVPPMSEAVKSEAADLKPQNSQKKGALQGNALKYEGHLAVDEHMRPDTEEMLRAFFEPFDAKLKITLEDMRKARIQLREERKLDKKGKALLEKFLKIKTKIASVSSDSKL